MSLQMIQKEIKLQEEEEEVIEVAEEEDHLPQEKVGIDKI